MNEAQFREAMERLKESPPLEPIITAPRAFLLITLLQTALRVPGLREATPNAHRVGEEMITALAGQLAAIDPSVGELLQTGNDPSYDLTPEQANQVLEGTITATEARLANAAELLLQAAILAEKPIVFSANEDPQVEGLTPANLEAVDLEPIAGLTIAIPCNGLEAQFLVNGLRTMLTAMPTIFREE